MPTVTSSAIQRVEYDARSRQLCVTFVTGNVYKYYDVPRQVYDRFLRTASKGAFFNEYVKDRYDFALMRQAG